jgi:hypothetical protein
METFYAHWQSFNFITATIVLIAYLLIDAMYAYYTLAITKKMPFTAASLGALMHFLIAFGVLNYVENYLYIIPIAIGSWIGTYLVVRYHLESEIGPKIVSL